MELLIAGPVKHHVLLNGKCVQALLRNSRCPVYRGLKQPLQITLSVPTVLSVPQCLLLFYVYDYTRPTVPVYETYMDIYGSYLELYMYMAIIIIIKIKMCSDRTMKIQPTAHLENYNRQTNRRT